MNDSDIRPSYRYVLYRQNFEISNEIFRFSEIPGRINGNLPRALCTFSASAAIYSDRSAL